MNEVKQFIPPKPLSTPVLFLIFNRLETTKQVFEAIRKAKPPRLYIGADGPRENKEGEAEKVKAVREYVMNHIDWECEVKTLFREKNLGCGKAVSEAITWFFENEEMGIILEDDTLPSQSFFWFCEELLNRYKNDKRVFMIAGTSYLFNEVLSEDDYFFSKYYSIWGWATWRDRWQEYDFSMKLFHLSMEKKLFDVVYYWDNYIKEMFVSMYLSAYHGKIDAWGYQWNFCCAINNGLCITPYKNLVSNIGYEGTRSSKNSPFINMKREEIKTEGLSCKMPVIQNLEIDRLLFYNVFYRYVNKLYILLKMFQFFLRNLRSLRK